MWNRSLAVLGVLAMTSASALALEPATVLFNQQVVQLDASLEDPTDLWVAAEDLERVNGFTLKPQGLCYEEICIPVKPSDTDLVTERDGRTWVSVTALARKVNQAVAHDVDARVWSLGDVPSAMGGSADVTAPDFELQDRFGNTVRLSDFRGKKVLLMTWASW